jgi:hypothetical protein
MSGEIRSQGTHIYFTDEATTSAPEIRRMVCPTSAENIGGGSVDRVEVSCLDNVAFKSFLSGLADLEAVNIPFVLKPGEAAHQALFEIRRQALTAQWAVALSESDDPPTLDSNEEFDPPATRSMFWGPAYIANLTVSATGNDAVRGVLTLQPTEAWTEQLVGV